MKLLPIILLLICLDVNSQTEYKIPTKKDTASLIAVQYDFKAIERKISKTEKVKLIKELIIKNDTSSCYFFTGYDSYFEFITNFYKFADSLLPELDRNIHLVRLNDDNEYDFIYDRLNFEWDFQNIYTMIKIPDGWKIQEIPGFIVVNVKVKNKKIIEYETYQWACCDFPYDFYYFIEQQNDSIIIKSKTAFSRLSEFPENITIDTTKIIEMMSDSLIFYSLNNGNLKNVYTINCKMNGVFIAETSIDEQKLVFARFKVENQNLGNSHFDYFIGWIKKEKVNYVW